MAIYFKNTLFITKENIEKEINNNEKVNVEVFESKNDLLNDISLKSINKDFIKPRYEICMSDDMNLNLFIDIDMNKKDIKKKDVLIKKFLKKKYKKDQNIKILLEFLIKEFLIFLFEKNMLNCIENKSVLKIDSLNQFLVDIYNDMGITKNINEEKISFHIFFSNIKVEILKIKEIKNLFKKFIEKSNHPLKDFIDLNVYKKHPNLRFIYSNKDIKDENPNFHYPILFKIKNDKLTIDYTEAEINNEDDLRKYLLFDRDYPIERKVFCFKNKNEEEDEENMDYCIDNSLISNCGGNILKDVPVAYITKKEIYEMIIKPKTCVLDEFLNVVLNKSDFDKTIIKDTVEMDLNLDYEKLNGCLFCKKTTHKNKHSIYFKSEGVVVVKKGVANNCNMRVFTYPKLTEYKICEYFLIRGLIKKYNKDFVVFSKTKGWELILNENIIELKNIMIQYSEDFRTSDRKILEDLKETTLKNIFKSFKNDEYIFKESENKSHLFKFRNGILDLKTNIFTEIKDAIEYRIINGVSYDYKDEKDYNDIEKKKHEKLINVINDIMPENKNGDKNDRKIFECNLSSSIIKEHKEVITIFQGNTSSGKSTIKQLLKNTLEDTNCIEIPISTYFNKIEPNKPNPWLGKINNKLVSISSESDAYSYKLNSQSIKLMTEISILARLLNSNEGEHENHLSQFIDTNIDLKLDKEDTAAYKRLAILRFNSYFKDPDNYTLFYSNGKTKLYDKNLKRNIINGEYKLIFFNILKKWALKYHSKNLKLYNTFYKTNYNKMNDIIKKLTYVSNNTKIKNIKDEYKNLYSKITVLQSDKVVNGFGIKTKDFESILNEIKNYYKIECDISDFMDILLNKKKLDIIPYVFTFHLKSKFMKKLYEKNIEELEFEYDIYTKEHNRYYKNKNLYLEKIKNTIEDDDDD